MSGVVDQQTGTRDADIWARRLSTGEPIDVPVALVVAHADDETLWAGSALARLTDLRLIHATDGAPRDMADAGRLGFGSRASYAAVRASELERALALLDADADRRAYGITDQEAVLCLPELVDRLENDLADRAFVVTHAYEGGHPDHDALALAVRLAVGRLARCGAAPAIVEFACYHLAEGERQFGRFWHDQDHPEHRRSLSPGERLRVQAALGAHASQAAVFNGWCPVAERWRAAPTYDFAAPPPPGASLYDGFGWSMTSARWRAIAADAIAAERACA